MVYTGSEMVYKGYGMVHTGSGMVHLRLKDKIDNSGPLNDLGKNGFS